MIISYTFKNFKSFKDEHTFYMIPVNKIKSSDKNILTFDFEHNLIKESKNKLLKVAAISGQNASGKSNFIESIKFMQKMVLKSFENFNDETDGINNSIVSEVKNFMYSSDENTSLFEINFIKKQTNFTYGFEINKNEVISEWLDKNDKGVNKNFFKRIHNKVTFGNKKNIKDSKKKLIKEILNKRKESLLLTLLMTLGEVGVNKEIQNVFNYFKDDIIICDNDSLLLNALANILTKEKKALIKGPESGVNFTFDLVKVFIKALDTRIVDLKVSEELKQEYPFIAIHERILKDGSKIQEELPFSEESSGTKKLLKTSFQIIRTLINENNVLIVDELDDKVHTNLFIEIIKIFQESESQFIFATHNPYILEHDLLRKDQIYFVDKNLREESFIYSLSDFKGVRVTESYQKRYLNGNYGAVPIIDFSEFKEKIFLGDPNE